MSVNSEESSTGELDLEFFKSINFTKRKCVRCGKYYWSSDPLRNTCGDPPCDTYSFIGNSPVWKPFSLAEMRENFLSFFGPSHKIIDPYPVVPRWRDDVLLVNASIYDFQPHVTSGRVKPPGNPLAMSQPSVRMNDTDLIGETGRHLTCFEMLCHDAFNYAGNFVYWKEETVAYCYRFLTESLKVEGSLITFKEKPWSGGGNGGNAFEVFVRGLEVATLVFMDLKEDPSGQFIIDGKKYSRMDMMIVDTGYGLERLTWLSQGTPTVYQAVMPEVVDTIVSRSGSRSLDDNILGIMSTMAVESEPFNRKQMIDRSMERLTGSGIKIERSNVEEMFEFARSVFVLADHTKTLMVLFSDHVIPSNVKVGYLARLLIRRAKRAIADMGIHISLIELILQHWRQFSEIFPGFSEKFAREALRIDEAKFEDLEKRSRQIVLKAYDRSRTLTAEDLVTLYDSFGVIPEEAASIIRAERGTEIEIPDDFNAMVVARHENVPRKEEARPDFPDLFTRPLYYDDPTMTQFNAIVLFSRDRHIITNQTAFYPEGGGQPYDTGYFIYHGKQVPVSEVHKYGRAVVHKVESEIPERSRVIGHINWERRHRLMVHHSATHLLLGVLREYLGNHVWQTGVQKGLDHSRIDITHFRRLNDEEVREVERRCLKYITENRAITVRNIEWNRAIEKYGFRLFEGGVPEGRDIRVVEIEGVDAEGCGGTHVRSTGELGFLKILNVETLQEGIQRITFAAGIAALDHVQSMSTTQKSLESLLSVKGEEVEEAVKRMWNENLELKKDRERRIKHEVDTIIAEGRKINVASIPATLFNPPSDAETLKSLISAVFSRKLGHVIIPFPEGSEIRVISGTGNVPQELVDKISSAAGGKPEGRGRHVIIAGINRDKYETLIREVFDASRT